MSVDNNNSDRLNWYFNDNYYRKPTALFSSVPELLDLWIELKRSVLVMQEYRNLQKDILQLKHSLGSIVVPNDETILDFGGYVDDLEKEVVKYEVSSQWF